jgi:PHD/YefM family antitoxin component YafN of YafNO toxin-antitoxin module
MKAPRRASRRSLSEPEIVYRNGRPTAVLLDIRVYERLLERLEDLHDLEVLNQRRKKDLVYRDFDAYLADRNS